MEWVETTAKTVEEAKELALDQLGVAADEAEFEIVEAPRPGLFGRLRGEARVRSRVRPAELRPKRDRRRKSVKPTRDEDASPATGDRDQTRPDAAQATLSPPARAARAERRPDDFSDASNESDASADEVGAAAVSFVSGLVHAMGFDDAVTTLHADGTELDVVVDGEQLGLLIGPGGRTLSCIQNLARVAAQRRLGDHDTRLRVDVAGYRTKRKAALEGFAAKLATDVLASGVARSLEPMPSTDRKIIHDALSEIDGVSSRSVGDDPYRRVIVSPSGSDDF